MKLMTSRISFLVQVILCFAGIAVAQEQPLDSLRKKFDHFRKHSLQEKTYVHVDRNFYLTGELLWFKLYVVDGSFHKPLDVSKVGYVEILDRNNTPILQAKIPLKKGMGNGSFFLPASLVSGNYQLRAYTNWMKNNSADYFYHQTITITNSFTQPEFDQPNQKRTVNVDFFPEGGNLVDGIPANVAFKIRNQSNEKNDYQGWILSASRDTIARFNTFHDGMGHFEMTPSSSVSYNAIVKDKNGIISSHPFPKVQEQGYAMAVDDQQSHIVVTVKTKLPDTLQFSLVYLFVHCRQVMVQAEAKRLDKLNSTTFKIEKRKFPDGISHITLFDREHRPVCERLYFQRPEKKLTVNIESNQSGYTTRKKVTLALQVNADQARQGNLSIAVYKDDSLAVAKRPGIYDFLWFTSDLKGTINSPEFYLSDDPKAYEAMDNLMLTHGWRRFKWDDVINKKTTQIFPPEYRSHIIRGQVTELDGKPAKGVMTYVASPDKIIRTYGSRSNANGDIQFEVKEFWGPRQLIAQVNTRYDSSRQISISNPFSTSLTSHSLPPFILSAATRESLLTRSIAMQVQDIYHGYTKDRFNTASVDSLPFYGKPDETYFLDSYTRFPVMEEVMREYVPGVIVRIRKDGFQFIVLDKIHKGVLQGDPMILLDGVPLFDADEIMSFDPRKVKRLDVITRKYYLGSLTIPGIVSYSTYEADLGGFTLNPKSVTMDYEGLQLQREFYSPEYEDQQKGTDRIPDQRDLLYWNPNLATDSDGKLTVEFYTSDLSGNYHVEAECLTPDGQAGSGHHTFSVNRFNN
jgi:hypothetical protein